MVEKVETTLESQLSEYFEKLYGPPNPYWKKWGRGRPSKAKIAERKRAYEWQEELYREHPEWRPKSPLSFLNYLTSSPSIEIQPSPNKRTVLVKYEQRYSVSE